VDTTTVIRSSQNVARAAFCVALLVGVILNSILR
jgi:hypothetical protein